jgi:hypothetical protein
LQLVSSVVAAAFANMPCCLNRAACGCRQAQGFHTKFFSTLALPGGQLRPVLSATAVGLPLRFHAEIHCVPEVIFLSPVTSSPQTRAFEGTFPAFWNSEDFFELALSLEALSLPRRRRSGGRLRQQLVEA